MSRKEHVARGNHPGTVEIVPGITIRPFASSACGARNLSTGTVTVAPGGRLAYHVHPCSEAITVLEGELVFRVEGREYLLGKFDNVHVPPGVVHGAFNPSDSRAAVCHFAFASADVTRDFVDRTFPRVDRGRAPSGPGDPEHVSRHAGGERYPLAERTSFIDLFAGRFGSKGICGGYGEFQPGTALPCHAHTCDESITIVGGRATCQIDGATYSLSGRDTVLIPAGKCHRFLNEEASGTMEMIWVYAMDEPGRTLVETARCTGQA